MPKVGNMKFSYGPAGMAAAKKMAAKKAAGKKMTKPAKKPKK